MHLDLTDSERARIWAKLGPPDENGCRDCTGSGAGRYAYVSIRGRIHKMSRLIFLLSGGILSPEQPLVCHRCNRPSCCEPTHLYADSHAGNMRYMAAQGRHGSQVHPERLARGDQHFARMYGELLPRGERHGTRTKPERVARGERHGFAKLTAALVAYARARYAAGGITQSALARECGVTQGVIGRAIRGDTWRHLP